jgi:hypothetical protein
MTKLNTLSWKKALKNLGKGETYLNIIKAICNEYVGNIILNGRKLKPFPLKAGKGKGKRVSMFSSLIQYSTRIHGQSNKSREWKEMDSWGKEDVKFYLFANMIL